MIDSCSVHNVFLRRIKRRRQLVSLFRIDNPLAPRPEKYPADSSIPELVSDLQNDRCEHDFPFVFETYCAHRYFYPLLISLPDDAVFRQDLLCFLLCLCGSVFSDDSILIEPRPLDADLATSLLECVFVAHREFAVPLP